MSKLADTVYDITHNPSKERVVKLDTIRFTKKVCTWIHSPCPASFVNIFQCINIPKCIIDIIATYIYDSIRTQIINIFNECVSKGDVSIIRVIPEFNRMFNVATCFDHKKLTHMTSRDKILSLCMYVNEMLPIGLEERKLRGTIISLGQMTLRENCVGDCCTWSSVGGLSSLKVVGKSNETFNTYANAVQLIAETTDTLTQDYKDYMINEIKDNPDGPSIFRRILAIARAEEMTYTLPHDGILNLITLIDKNFTCLKEIQDKMIDLEEGYEKEKKEHIMSLKLFTRHKIMEAMYTSDKQPMFSDFICGLCKSEAFMTCPCKTVRYCSSKCQSAHWCRHKKKCKRKTSCEY